MKKKIIITACGAITGSIIGCSVASTGFNHEPIQDNFQFEKAIVCSVGNSYLWDGWGGRYKYYEQDIYDRYEETSYIPRGEWSAFKVDNVEDCATIFDAAQDKFESIKDPEHQTKEYLEGLTEGKNDSKLRRLALDLLSELGYNENKESEDKE